MCLSVVLADKPKPEGRGWKTFDTPRGYRSEGVLVGSFLNTYKARPIGQWIHKKDFAAGTASAPDDGFHIYFSKYYAQKLVKQGSASVLRRVRYRGAHHQGFGDGCGNVKARVVVADEIFIEEEKETRRRKRGEKKVAR